MALLSNVKKAPLNIDVPWSKNEPSQVNSIRSMKLFTEWDVENASPSCVTRSCCLRVNRLQVFKPLEPDLKALVISVAIQGSRRSLRSDQIFVEADGIVNADLDLNFTLQYPHFLKRRENRLQIMLQRRKKYKTRTILGYRTLAIGYVNMTQVLQGWFSNQINLFTKYNKSPVASLSIVSLTSEPIERDSQDKRIALEPLNSTDEEGDEEYTDSDVDDSGGEIDSNMPSQNFKQRIIRRLFKKLKVSDADLDVVQSDLQRNSNLNVEEYLFEDDDEDDDSDNDVIDDNLSIASVQKPGLRPYFDHGQSQTMLNQSILSPEIPIITGGTGGSSENDNTDLDSNLKDDSGGVTTDENSGKIDTKLDKVNRFPRNTIKSLSFHERRAEKPILERKGSVDVFSKHKESFNSSTVNEQISQVLGNDDKIPEYMLIASAVDENTQNITFKLLPRLNPIIFTSEASDVHGIMIAVANKFQKFCNRHSVAPPPTKIVIFGREAYLRDVLQGFVEQFSLKRQEYQNFIRFLIIPNGPHKLANYLGHMDKVYSSLFLDNFWTSLFDPSFISDTDLKEIERRISYYIENADIVHTIPIAEALVTCKLPNGESSQSFIPFIMEVSIGNDGTCAFDTNDTDVPSTYSAVAPKENSIQNSERNGKESTSSSKSDAGNDLKVAVNHNNSNITEKQDLLVDYWPLPNLNSNQSSKREDKRDGNKLSIKSTFKSLCVSRMPREENDDLPGLLFNATIKNRNKGVKRLMNKKDKDSESKAALSVAVSKIVCTARSSGQTFNVMIDSGEWTNVKFFSLSSQWPTHIKQFPIAMTLNYMCADST